MPAAVALVVVLAGCGGANKAGGDRAERATVLTLASGATDKEELQPFVDEVARLSGGTLRVELRNNWRRGQTRFEDGLIADVRAGKADLGWTGSRALDSAGVPSFRALDAPLLVDSYPLEAAVLRSPVVRPMLRALGGAGLVGLGVLPGSFRRPFGIRTPLVAPADFAGLTIGVQQSRVADATMRALGARPVWIPVQGIDIRRFGGIEQRLPSINGWGYERLGRYLSANVDLWPRPLVLFANRRAFARLDAQQRDVLRRSVRGLLGRQLALDRRLDLEAAGDICRSGLVRFESASPAQLAALRRAVQPVYDELERDPATSTAIRAIEALKRAAPAPPDATPPCAAGPSRAAARPTPLDGVWRMTTRFGDIPGDAELAPENYGRWTFVFDRGRFAITQRYRNACTWGYGRFTVTGRETAWTFTDGGGIAPRNAANKPGEFFRFTWSRYRDVVRVEPVRGAISPPNFRAKPWHLISSTPSRRLLDPRCPPPAAALAR